jgi:predicted permease
MFWRRRKPGDFSSEIQSHIAMETDRLQAQGMSFAEARAAALREFGSPAASDERYFESSPAAFFETQLRDLRYALRVLRKNPGFTLVAVLSLALGIGANTAIFQLADAVRLRMLPVKDPQSLAQVQLTTMKGVRGSRRGNNTLSYPIWEQIASRQQALSETFAWGLTSFDLATSGEPRFAQGMAVSGGFFRSLGIQPALGRVFAESDDRPGCGFPGVVISYAFWQRQFGGQASALGSKITLNRNPVEIVGATPASFFGMEVGRYFDVAVPICSMAAFPGQRDLTKSGTDWWLTVMGRLNPGWSVERAASSFESLSPAVFTSSLPANYPPVSVKDYLALRLTAKPAGSGVSNLRQQYTEPLWLLLGIAGLVLLIACANLANLTLARASARGREIALRLAIGASRGSLVRQLMTESLLISLLGAALGLAAAQWLSRLLVSLLSTMGNTVFLNLDRDWRVFAFAGALALVTGLLFGLAPALRSAHIEIGEVLKSAGRGSTDGRERFGLRRLLVVVQVALSLVLVMGALLFTGTLNNLLTAETGFRPEGVLIARVAFGSMSLSPAGVMDFRRQLADRLRTLPGVAAVGDTDVVPFSGSTSNAVWMAGTPQTQAQECKRSHIGPGYFDALVTKLLAGRSIDSRDTSTSPRVAVVNEAFARVLLDGQNPVGKRLWVEATPFEPSAEYEIVGMVRNTKYQDLREDFQPIVFQAQAQDPVTSPGDSYLIRSRLPMDSLIPAVRAAFTDASPKMRYQFQIFQTAIRDTLIEERLMASLSAAFGILAALLAAIGLYGVMSYLVARRRNEIGIRMALGAGRREIVAMVLRESGLLLAAGVLAGTLLSLLSTRAVATLLFGVKAMDIKSLLTAAALLAVVALAASYLPARRAANLNPTVALREE